VKLHSVKFKISVLYTVILGIILVVYSIMLYLGLSYLVYREIDQNLQKKAKEIRETIHDYSNLLKANKDSMPVSLRRVFHLDEVELEELLQWPSIKRLDQLWKYKVQALGIKQDYIVMYYPTGEVAEKSNNVDESLFKIMESSFKGIAQNKTVIKNYGTKEVRLRIVTSPLYDMNRIKYIIQLATPIDKQLFTLWKKWKIFVMTIPILLFLASFIGRFLVIKIFEPIKSVIKTARTISYEDMSKRVELEHADEELEPLVDAFNDMISRLDKSFKYIEEFSSNVVHELKTPLAIIRGELELALRKNRNPEEYKKAIGVALEEAQRMLKTINDLLLLVKLDYRTEAFKFERLDLVDFLTEIYEQSKILALEKNISISLDAPFKSLMIEADRLHLRRLFLNLLDNAIKFTPKGGQINIAVQGQEHLVSVAISDTGVGIAKEDLPKIFDRFFHIDRTDEASSVNGLGLSIVQSIAKIHRGTVEVSSQLVKGSTFTVKLPLS
jgi:heavy metal sensor kinase